MDSSLNRHRPVHIRGNASFNETAVTAQAACNNTCSPAPLVRELFYGTLKYGRQGKHETMSED